MNIFKLSIFTGINFGKQSLSTKICISSKFSILFAEKYAQYYLELLFLISSISLIAAYCSTYFSPFSSWLNTSVYFVDYSQDLGFWLTDLICFSIFHLINIYLLSLVFAPLCLLWVSLVVLFLVFGVGYYFYPFLYRRVVCFLVYVYL